MYFFDWRECWEGTEFLGTESIRLILTFDGEYIFSKFRFRQEKIVTIAEYTERAIEISSRTGCWNWHHCCMVFAGGGSFQDVCGELIGMGQNRPNLLWGAFRISLIIQEMKIAEKKSESTKFSVQQTTEGEQPIKNAANQHWVHVVIRNALLVK